ncbi:helix-turn-helix domain-containing protein [Ottowia sp.]|uniref:helix-turn-helix domain-containing protein n=1 Tax=Ottowia sp. TaxID=1898956 RepID=UPI003A8766F5
MRIDPVSLQVFVAVVETGSIAAAAEREYLAAAAISRRIAELEELLATPLLIRHARAGSSRPQLAWRCATWRGRRCTCWTTCRCNCMALPVGCGGR